MEDWLLVMKCRRGDQHALRRIYEKYRDYLLISAIVLLNDVDTAEDIVHDAFVTFARRARTFELTGSLRAYLAVCVVNLARNRLKSKRYQTVNLGAQEPAASDSGDPIKAVICNEALQRLSSALARLTHEQREVIVLHIYDQMSFGTIARSQNISINTVKSRYRYGIDRLKSLLE